MKNEANLTRITTADGSHTIKIEELDETFHSIHGAIQESNHVYVNAGFKYLINSKKNAGLVRILEFGFGTGLNALLTAIECRHNTQVVYHSLEKYPLPSALSDSLNYGITLNESEMFRQIHDCPWGEAYEIHPRFTLQKIVIDFREYASNETFDLIYFDAFAPGKQPELWSKKVFEKCYTLLAEGGALVTYSAKGQLKRDLKTIGFRVESLPGPPGKFEITRAIKSEIFP